jgi:signal transduction histidine kinase
MLFIEKFLNLYSIKRLSRLIHIVISIALVDLVFTLIFHHAIIIKFIPSFIWILVVLSEAHRLIKKKDIPFYFIIVGWSTVLLVSIFEFLGISAITFPYLHLAFAIESMLLSFAVSYKFNLIEEEKKVQQTLLLQQSRLASMGEMISIIAHQWRQPLNFLSFALMHIKRGCKNDEEALLTIKDASEQLQYMSQTIENFRNFYNPSKNKAEFSIQKSCENTLKIVSPTLLPSKIDMKLDIKEDFKFFANSNEFEQVILNIINNARDILVERKVENPKIEITINKPQIAIIDNGGGVAKENIDKIFEPYFTTKKNSDGIGLYISKTIIENEMKGKLELITDSNGSSFVITF